MIHLVHAYTVVYLKTLSVSRAEWLDDVEEWNGKDVEDHSHDLSLHEGLRRIMKNVSEIK
jgi:hypothetical protein